MIGQTIAHYRVTAKIGAGGMGEVYRATDSKLGREVALKVLPQAFASDPQRMQRFQREAQVLASLNHPHIAAIHGLEESGATRALAMELVEGPTLAERIGCGSARAGKPVPLEEALPIAKQVAEALEYAHERGIIHRDLKPANIKLTTDGQVKVLDFGLAKALADDPASGSDLSNSPTLSVAATKAGIILGTAAYMPPEQAKGKAVDRRADIWSFGCVLFEMLSGQRAFAGEDVTETLAAVIRGEPEWSALPFASSHPISRLLRRCLERDVKRRLQAIGEARVVIEDYLANPAAAQAEGVSAQASAALARTSRAAWTIAALATMAAVAFGVAYFWRPGEEPRVVRAFIQPPEKTNFDFVGHPSTGPVAISPDGRALVFAADSEDGSQRLWVREIDSLTARPLPGTDDGAFPFWSPDSRAVGFFAEGKLRKVNVAGGPPVTLCDAVSGRGGTWNREGVIVFSPDASAPLRRVSEAGGDTAPLTQFDTARGESSHRWPHFLPDGRHFLYLARGGPGLAGLAQGEGTNIMLGSLDGSAPRVLMPGRYAASYASGYLLMVRENTLMAQPFDAERLEFTGDPFPVAPQLQLDLSFSRSVFSVSENGVLVYQAGETPAGSQLIWFDRAGKQVGVLGDQAVYLDLVISPDGRKVATSITDPGIGPPDVWIYEVSRGLRTRFTFAAEVERHPVWAPDNTRVVFSFSPVPFRIYEKSLAGIAKEGALLESQKPVAPQSWSSDGRFLAYEARGVPNTLVDIWVMPLAGERKPMPFLQTPFVESSPRFSPDGRWIAYVSHESGRSEVYVAPFPGPGRKLQISTAGGQHPRWRRDGREIYYLSDNNKMMAVVVSAIGDTFEIGASTALFETRPNRNGNVYDVSGDGQRFLVNTLAQAQTSEPLTLVVNWPTALKNKK